MHCCSYRCKKNIRKQMGSIHTWRKNKTGINAVEFAKEVEVNGAGEILLTSMDKDGLNLVMM